jgi:hypothetical protein
LDLDSLSQYATALALSAGSEKIKTLDSNGTLIARYGFRNQADGAMP